MGKALKPLVIVVFILSAAALALGVLLYGKREILKGRIVKLEDSTQSVARNIQFSSLNVAQLQDFEAMDGQIRPLGQAVKNTFDELVSTSNTLVQTQDTLKETKSSLEQTKSDLQASQDTVAELEEAALQRRGASS